MADREREMGCWNPKPRRSSRRRERRMSWSSRETVPLM